jgi:hypothetical protein
MWMVVRRTSQTTAVPDSPPCEGAVLRSVPGLRGKHWCVKITSLRGLIEFMHTHRRLVVQVHPLVDQTVWLEIYDSYRE